ncbi:hypothetical protein BDE27_0314 [Xenorhabdus ehlersii]|uniref:Uncharacterized protein n=1 Tax=Xenorhabdus ehlersii TaxID=290111 RepID=A0A2D0IMN9_9GAMM|nr:hypothetical protein Xehl_03224 [Xenorhabdus ehlersii]RKE92658.1 hypothetical protein BDE27_0314 [Xenorhabdus ehlersii]
MKTLKIDWLGRCDRCEREDALVETENGTSDWLYEGDRVMCSCGHTGYVAVSSCEPVAYAVWDELVEGYDRRANDDG